MWHDQSLEREGTILRDYVFLQPNGYGWFAEMLVCIH
jgi:hypothetical protein